MDNQSDTRPPAPAPPDRLGVAIAVVIGAVDIAIVVACAIVSLNNPTYGQAWFTIAAPILMGSLSALAGVYIGLRVRDRER